MAFTPASSLEPVAVTVSGAVSVSNFPATQPVSGTVAVSGVTGTVLVDGSAHPQPVTGPLTNTELRAADVEVSQGAGGLAWAVVQATVPWLVDASGYPVPVTGPLTDAELRASELPVSAASLPLPDGAATEETLVEVKRAANDTALTAILERDTLAA